MGRVREKQSLLKQTPVYSFLSRILEKKANVWNKAEGWVSEIFWSYKSPGNNFVYSKHKTKTQERKASLKDETSQLKNGRLCPVKSLAPVLAQTH